MADIMPTFGRRESAPGRVVSSLGPNPSALAGGTITCQIGQAPGDFAGGEQRAEVGWIHVDGELDRQRYQEIISAVDTLLGANVQRAGLIVNTGGGALAGLDGATRALLELRRAVDGRLWSFAPEIATSAGYTLLAAAPRGNVFASMGAQVGGLGGRIRLEDTSRLWSEGLLTDVHEIVGRRTRKPMGAPGHPVSDADLEFAEAQRASGDRGFIRLTAAARGISPAALDRIAAEGGSYESAIAQDLGLIDRVLDEPAFQAIVIGSTTATEEAPMPNRPTPQGPSQGAANPPVGQQAAQNNSEIPNSSPPAGSGAPQQAATPAQPAQPQVPASRPASGPVPVSPPPPPEPATHPTAVMAQPQGQIDMLAAQMSQLTSLVGQLAAGIAAQGQQSRIAAITARIEACHDRATPEARQATLAAATAMVELGQDPEAVIAGLEAAPPIQDLADLSCEVTYQPPGAQQAQTMELPLDYFARPGANGEATVPTETRNRAVEALTAVANAPDGQRWNALEALFRQRGFLGGALERVM